MTTERSFAAVHDNLRDPLGIKFQWSMATLTSLVGVLGLIHESRMRQVLESWINVHALFGVLLVGLVVARFYSRLKCSAPMHPTEIGEFSRRLSRLVYLLLYGVIGLRQTIGIVNYFWHGGPFDFNLSDTEFRRGPDREGFDPKDDLQAFVAYGLIALVTVRVLAYRVWLRLSDHPVTADCVEPMDHGRNASPNLELLLGCSPAERVAGIAVAPPPDIRRRDGRANPRAE